MPPHEGAMVLFSVAEKSNSHQSIHCYMEWVKMTKILALPGLETSPSAVLRLVNTTNSAAQSPRHTCQDKVIPGFSAHVKIIKKKMIFASLNSALNLKAARRHDWISDAFNLRLLHLSIWSPCWKAIFFHNWALLYIANIYCGCPNHRNMLRDLNILANLININCQKAWISP